ncbi:MAG TPA: carboxypeptidase regulatory-like domain-containing protein [Pyrinomonadaceae bacterium]|nr:carboxypeptidase regulatory-like domain-containing protein [Pyrinomonadaceae bacterium]
MNTRTRTRATSSAPAKSLALALAAALALFAHASAGVCRAQSQTQPQPQAAARPADAGAAARERGARERSPGAITGRVVGESGEPLPGALVYAGQRGTAPQLSRTQRVQTDDEGNFQITGLDPGLYSVVANIPGYVPDTDFSTGRPLAYRTGDTALLRLVKGGVITGAVTDTQGEAVVGLGVRAYRVRDLDGRPATFGYSTGSEDRTDDRGVYRIFGLMPGVYVVAAGASSRGGYFYGYVAAYAGDVPTFYPSATRDTATEITVRAGQESSGVDIRFRDEQGRSVTGRVEPPAGSQADPGVGFNVTLAYASTGIQAGISFVQPNVLAFSFEGVADGDYDVQASAGGREGQLAVSTPQRVSVRGADVTGLRLALAPLASVVGSLAIEPTPATLRESAECRERRAPALPQETLVTLVSDRPAPAKGQAVTRTSLAREATPDASGSFTLRGLEPGRYRLLVRPFDDALYVSSVQLPATAAPAPDSDRGPTGRIVGQAGAAAPAQTLRATAPREGLDVRAGQQVSGVSVRLAAGAALLSGRVAAAEGSAPPAFTQLRVYLVPAERESADDPLRYFDATPDASGAFAFRNLPPGRYLLVARPAPEPTPGAPARAPYWDADSRARLRREAESAKSTVELQPCQRAADFTLRLPK